VELNNGSTIRLTALIPFYKPTAANWDVDATLHALNAQLARHKTTNVDSRTDYDPESGHPI
jgi:hypothetical protein